MANTNNPRGFSPVGHLLGLNWSEKTRMYSIADDAANTYAIGDVVKIAAGADTNGIVNVTKLTGGGAAGDIPVGVIVGFIKPAAGVSLVGSPLTQEKIWLPKSSGQQYALVVDDPFVIFEAQFDSTVIVNADLHKNAAYTVTADQTASLAQSSPYSNIVLTTPNTGVTYPLKLFGVPQRPNTQANLGAYTKVLCMFNYHQYGIGVTATGSAGA